MRGRTKKKYTIKKTHKTSKARVFKKNDFTSGDGFLTKVWGPALWHSIHIISFNYPINPTTDDKKNYRDFIMSLQFVLPCKYCRENIKKNLDAFPLTTKHMKNRESFSRYIYELHEIVNKMLKKKSGLSYCDVRERYEHFRARCNGDTQTQNLNIKDFLFKRNKIQGEKGCTEPLYGKKSKCIIKIIPDEEKQETLQIDEKCKKKRI
jgi:hypothetical protein